MLIVPQTQVLTDSQSISEAQLRYNLEHKRLEFEHARIQAEMKDRKAERQAKLEAEERKARV